MELEFRGEIIHWRGPAPFYFIPVPEAECAQLEAAAAMVSYGWGVIPVTARIGATTWTTSLFPKDGGYLVPVKADVRRAEGLEEADETLVRLTVAV